MAATPPTRSYNCMSYSERRVLQSKFGRHFHKRVFVASSADRGVPSSRRRSGGTHLMLWRVAAGLTPADLALWSQPVLLDTVSSQDTDGNATLSPPSTPNYHAHFELAGVEPQSALWTYILAFAVVGTAIFLLAIEVYECIVGGSCFQLGSRLGEGEISEERRQTIAQELHGRRWYIFHLIMLSLVFSDMYMPVPALFYPGEARARGAGPIQAVVYGAMFPAAGTLGVWILPQLLGYFAPNLLNRWSILLSVIFGVAQGIVGFTLDRSIFSGLTCTLRFLEGWPSIITEVCAQTMIMRVFPVEEFATAYGYASVG